MGLILQQFRRQNNRELNDVNIINCIHVQNICHLLKFQAEIAIWAPGAMIGVLSFIVMVIFQLLPETQGRDLPRTMQDIELWYKDVDKNTEQQKDSEDGSNKVK